MEEFWFFNQTSMDIERVAPAPVLIVPAFRSINQQLILRAKYGSGMK